MKKMKKLLSLLVCVIMVLGMSMSAFAAQSGSGNNNGTIELTVNHIAAGHEFTAYQIFQGTVSDEGVITGIDWGTGVDGAALLAALKADETELSNADGSETIVIKNLFATATTANDVANVIKSWTSGGSRLDRFAEIAGKCLSTGKASNPTVVQNGDVYTYSITGLQPGYYLIKDTTVKENGKPLEGKDFKTKYMLYLTTNTNITTKGDYSIVEKTVSEVLDGTYKDYLAEQLNRTYYYKLEASLDDEIAWYDKYKLVFTDTMSAGLDFENIEEIYILEADNNKVYLYDHETDGAFETWKNGQTNNFIYSVNKDDTTGKTTLILGWKDLKSANSSIAGDDKVIVKYSATLNTSAVFGVDGNPNEVVIEFSNSPSSEGTGVSLPDDAKTFSFQLKVIKVDADNQETKLSGAVFKLYHKHGEEKQYAIVESGKITRWTTDINAATELVTGTDGTFGYNLQGLKEDTLYYLTEVQPPENYNPMFNDVSVIIHPNFVTTEAGVITYDKLTYLAGGKEVNLTSGAEFANGTVTVTVLNDKGNTLPTTGGIGTTIFYAAGGVLVAAAVVVLVTKKRMSVNK